MCGIAALFSTSNPVSAELLCCAIARLQHRGPDNQECWVDPERIAGLAHARLSLLDLSPNGNQPISSADGSLSIIHNGEFYDFESIRRECESRGHQFRSCSDSEILIPLYKEIGTAALRRLRGEFAFVLWDRNNRLVFAARDRFGIKPLFYALHEGSLYFASEVKALFAMGVPARWDVETAYLFHATWLLPPHRTLYRNVFQIPPGHFLLSAGGDGFTHPRIVSYWDFDYPDNEESTSQSINPREAIAAVRALVEESVRLRLRADVPVACYLSGGLDSCSVLGIAARQSALPIHTFTLSFVDDTAYDEREVAREMAATSGSVYHEVPVHWHDLAENFETALWHAETPFLNTHGIAKFLLSKAVRKAQFKAVLTGEGADEVFGGYVHFRKDVLLQRGPADSEGQLAQMMKQNVISQHLMRVCEQAASLHRLNTTLGFVPTFMGAFSSRCDQSQELLNKDFRAAFRRFDAWQVLLNQFDLPRQLNGRLPINQSLYLWSRTMLPNYVLTVLGDRMEMSHSIEGRVPFLDHKLVEYVTHLPAVLKINESLTEKYILREATRPFITDTAYRRQKHPFMAPPSASTPQSSLFQYAQDTIRSQVFGNSPFYDQKEAIQLLDSVGKMSQENQMAVDRVLTVMLSFVLLQQRLGLTT